MCLLLRGVSFLFCFVEYYVCICLCLLLLRCVVVLLCFFFGGVLIVYDVLICVVCGVAALFRCVC